MSSLVLIFPLQVQLYLKYSLIDSLFSSIPDFVASNLINVPGYENVQFEIWASKIEKGGVEVDVVEVRNPKPFDPNRKESNEYHHNVAVNNLIGVSL